MVNTDSISVPGSGIQVYQRDCLELLKELPDESVDLVFTSPPYELARCYGINFQLRGDAWVDWALERYLQCVRVCRGLVAWVVDGQTRQFRWSATPVLLMAQLHRQGVSLRKPPIYRRNGIPGSGGREWLRNDYEYVICSAPGKLPWADNTAMGHPPKCSPGGAPSHQHRSGRVRRRPFQNPVKANPGNVIDCGAVGGGNIGNRLAHENEAPFPERLAEFFVRSFCPPDGIVLDPFSGSGTTLAVAQASKRRGLGIDIRSSQVELTRRRCAEFIGTPAPDTLGRVS